MIKKLDLKNKYVSMFNPETGFYIRTGVLENGKDTGVDPFMSSFPELIDIGVMGHCEHGKSGLCVKSGVKCYQSGLNKYQDNMTFENFKKIIDECKGKVFQVALGGRGDVNKHENFAEILKYCRDNNIVPNYTTSGMNLTQEEVDITKKYCGAVAVSWYRNLHTRRAIDMFLKAGCKTNIHYVLGNFSIDEAINRIDVEWYDGWPSGFPVGINAVIFLLHKPVGLAGEDEMLNYNDPKVDEFFKLVDKGNQPFKIGFDSCSVPAILNMTKEVSKTSVDTCEGARWSMYITPNMYALPCSFDQDHKWAFSIIGNTIQEAWESHEFEDFRNSMRNSCSGCGIRNDCMGGCPIIKKIVLCNRKERT